MKRFVIAFLFIFFTFLNVGCSPPQPNLPPNPQTYTLKVKVFNEYLSELSGVKITIVANGCSQAGESYSDTGGMALVTIICSTAPLETVIRLEKDGYELASRTEAVSTGVVYQYLLKKESPLPPESSFSATPTQARLETLSTPLLSPTLEYSQPNSSSSHLAFAREIGGIPQIFLTDKNETFTKQITRIPDGACQPIWSPDGRRLLFISPCDRRRNEYRDASLYVISVPLDPQDIAPRDGDLLISPSGGVCEPSWSINGIIYTGRDGDGRRQIYYIADLNRPTSILLSNPVSEEFAGSFSLDGNAIIFFRVLPSYREGLLLWAPLDDFRMNLSKNQVVNSDFDNIFEPDWQPGGDLIVFVKENQLWTVVWKQRKTNQVTNLVKAGSIHDPDWSYDGHFIAFSADKYTYDLDIWYVPLSGSPAKPIAVTDASEYHPAWRP